METHQPPSFDEWVHYCVVQGYSDFSDSSVHDNRFLRIPLPLLAEYLTMLFESPAWLAERYTDADLGNFTSFVFGVASWYISLVRRGPLPHDVQTRCIDSIATLYTDLFDKVCGARGADPDTDLRELSEIDGAVYMIWDMDCLEGTVLFPHEHPHLVEPGINIIQTVLDRCRTSTCLISALHGAGHIVGFHSRSGNDAIVSRVQGIIDIFLRRRRAPEWVREYALDAREGMVL